MNMYKLRRIIFLNAQISDNWIHLDTKIESKEIYVSDEDMEMLHFLASHNEYQYFKYDNVLHLDRAPYIIEENINNKKFIDNYVSNLDDKHYISYYYSYIGDKNE